MPSMSLSVPHQLGRDEAISRLKNESEQVKSKFGAQVSDLQETWEDDLVRFQMKVMGMKVNGQVEFADDEVLIKADLPMAAAIFRGMIEQQIRSRLEAVLV